MGLNERPLVLLLSILNDGQRRNLTEITLALAELLKKVSGGHLRADELSWLNTVESIIVQLRWKAWAALVDEESHKFQITALGKWIFKKERMEMEKYLGIQL